jgi:hypothetical protein
VTGHKLFRHLRRAGVLLAATGAKLAYDAPAGVLTAERRALMKARKPELLAIVTGSYLMAAKEMLLTLPEMTWDPLAEMFDERAGIVEFDGNVSRREAERTAYVELARAVEQVTTRAGDFTVPGATI